MVKLLKLTAADVKLHNTLSDGWIIVEGWVVDVTHFLKIHPGGPEIIVPYLGQDATSVFYDSGVHHHSKASLDTMDKFIVGYVEGRKTEEEIGRLEGKRRTLEDFGIKKDKGLLWQAINLGNDYDELIHNVLVVTGPSLRFFDGDKFEMATRSPWYTVPLVWLPLSSLLFFRAVVAGLPLVAIPFFLLIAPFLWNILEYHLHRYLFHMKPTGYYSRLVHFLLHGYHHLYPGDPLRLTFPPVPALIIAVAIFYFSGIFLLPPHIGYAIMASLALGYVYYDLTHYYLHHIPAEFLWMPFLKTSHLYHHFKNETANFGISLWIFDYIFSTFDATMLNQLKKNKQKAE